jgi:hypothetical protein
VGGPFIIGYLAYTYDSSPDSKRLPVIDITHYIFPEISLADQWEKMWRSWAPSIESVVGQALPVYVDVSGISYSFFVRALLKLHGGDSTAVICVRDDTSLANNELENVVILLSSCEYEHLWTTREQVPFPTEAYYVK